MEMFMKEILKIIIKLNLENILIKTETIMKGNGFKTKKKVKESINTIMEIYLKDFGRTI